MFRDCSFSKNRVTFKLLNFEGRVLVEQSVPNTVSLEGRNCFVEQLRPSPAIPRPGWMELGAGLPAPPLLGSYIAGSRAAFTSVTREASALVMSTVFSAGAGTGQITEAGVFNVASENSGQLLLYTRCSPIIKKASDVLVVTWTWELVS